MSNLKPLRTEFENAKIIDFRDPNNPNNSIVITCEHASNSLPEGYSWTDSDRTYFANEHWAWDPASLDVAQSLAAELKCILVHSLYSRLLCDVNRDVTSDALFRQQGDGRKIDLNQNLTRKEELKRIHKYYSSYYIALREISEKIDPTYIISIHSYNSIYEGKMREMEIGVLFTDSEKLGKKMHEKIAEKGYNVKMNDPWPADLAIAMNCIARANYPVRREGITLEFRNDIIQEPKKATEVKKDVLEVVKETCVARRQNVTGC